jgi:hypothetical protein
MARRHQPRIFHVAVAFPFLPQAVRPWFDTVRLSYENLRNQHQLAWLYDGCVLVDTYRAGDDTPVWVRERLTLVQESLHGP